MRVAAVTGARDVLVVLGIVLCSLLSIAPMAVAEDHETPPAAGADLTLSVTPVVGQRPADGDLIAVEGSPAPVALLFSPNAPAEQRAVYDIRVQNTGQLPLGNVAVSGVRLGSILGADEGQVLEPGQDVVLRAAMTFTFDEVAGGLGGLFEESVTASATTEDDGEVTDTATTVLELVAVLATPSMAVDLEVLADAGDVQPGDPPSVQWTASQLRAGEQRVARYRVTVTNTGDVALGQLAIQTDGADDAGIPLDADLVLAPGDVLVREFERTVAADELAPAGGGDPEGVDLVTTVTATGVDVAQGAPGAARDEVVLRAVLAPEAGTPATDGEVVAGTSAELPAAGGPLVAVGGPGLLLLLGGLVLLAAPRVRAGGRRHT